MSHDGALDPREAVLRSRMTAVQRLGVALCCAIMAIDGYDTIAITFAMPGIGVAWGTGKAALGLLFSLGIIGMAGGCLLLGPMADGIGRRPMALFSLLLMTAGMTLSALAPDISWLMVWRLCTGVGIGAALSVAYPLSVEYSNRTARPMTLAMMVISFPLGGAIGGFFVSHLMVDIGWRAAFLPGIVVPPVVILLCLKWLPEPLGLLIEKPRPSSLARANAYLRSIGQPPVERLPLPSRPGQSAVGRVLGREFRSVTGCLAAVYCFYTLTAYFLLAWLPQIVTDRGFTPALASTVSVAVSIGGVAGAPLTGVAIRRFGVLPVLAMLLVGLGSATFVIGIAPAELNMLRALGVVAGIFVFGPIVALTLLIAEQYPVEVRGTGMGFIVGLSRWVAAIGPLIGGLLISSPLGIAGTCLLIGLAAFLAVLLLAPFRATGRRTEIHAPAETTY